MQIVPGLSSDDHADSPVTIIAEEVTFQWIDGGRIYLSRLGRHNADSFLQWEETFRITMDAWPTERLLCVLFDLRTQSFGFSLAEGTRLRSLVNDYLYIHSAVALIYPDTLRARAMVAPLTFIPAPDHQSYNYLTDYEMGLLWLQEQHARSAE